MATTTVNRVSLHTAEAVNRCIQEEAQARIRQCTVNPAGIDRHLRKLDEEWDVERLLETNASILAFTGVVLGATVDKRWLALPALVTAFLFQHAMQGWCPPVPILRRMGYRTAREVEIERVALKTLRGDFGAEGSGQAGDSNSRASWAYQAARR
jgi:hypothetical protein